MRRERSGWSSTCPRWCASSVSLKSAPEEKKLAKAQAVKPKFSFADLFKGKPKPVARPASHSSTQTKIPAAGGPATRPGQVAKAAAAAARSQDSRGSGALAGFRLPLIGDRPLTYQLQVLGSAALMLL